MMTIPQLLYFKIIYKKKPMRSYLKVKVPALPLSLLHLRRSFFRHKMFKQMKMLLLLRNRKIKNHNKKQKIQINGRMQRLRVRILINQKRRQIQKKKMTKLSSLICLRRNTISSFMKQLCKLERKWISHSMCSKKKI